MNAQDHDETRVSHDPINDAQVVDGKTPITAKGIEEWRSGDRVVVDRLQGFANGGALVVAERFPLPLHAFDDAQPVIPQKGPPAAATRCVSTLLRRFRS